jgi:hypothetical protein
MNRDELADGFPFPPFIHRHRSQHAKAVIELKTGFSSPLAAMAARTREGTFGKSRDLDCGRIHYGG